MDVKHFNSKKLYIFFIVLVYICEILSSEVPRPRGVSLSRASLYIPGKDFTCFDGVKKIPFTQVNDDYCDCPDGSDEPGTSACPNGSFYCTNAGHKPIKLASSRVNDGICDCCDGSDEYNSGKTCANNCLELGKTAREEAQRMAELIRAGKEVKIQLSQKGITLKQEKKEKLVELEKIREEALTFKNEKAEILQKAQDLEQAALEKYRKLEEEERLRKAQIEEEKTKEEGLKDFQEYDLNQDGRIDVVEIKEFNIFDKDRNGEVSDEEAKYFLNEHDSVDETAYLEYCWPLIKSHKVQISGIYTAPKVETKEEATEAEDLEGEQPEGDDEEEEGENEEDEVQEHHEEPVEESLQSTTYDEETQRLVAEADAARKESTDADKQVRDIETEIKNIQEYLEKDFGPEEEFATLDGECYDYLDHEYIYKLCPFRQTIQNPVSGGTEIRLGSWSKWDGPDDDKYSIMMFDKGQNCWNGPQRTTRVKVSCGSENKVTSVSEPNRCEYLFEFTTPAACRELLSDNSDLHDEL